MKNGKRRTKEEEFTGLCTILLFPLSSPRVNSMTDYFFEEPRRSGEGRIVTFKSHRIQESIRSVQRCEF